MATTTKSKRGTASKSMDALMLLKKDHDEVKGLFGQFEKAKDTAKQRQLAEHVCMELTIHAQIEEQSFYPEVKSLPDVADMVMESLEEHRQVKEMVAKIQLLSASDDHLEPDMKVLKEDVEHHAEEEEKEMFPKVKKGLGKERLEELGQTLVRQKETMKRRMQGEQRVTEEVVEPERARR
jgi:hemerythrin superfamily protein